MSTTATFARAICHCHGLYGQRSSGALVEYELFGINYFYSLKVSPLKWNYL